MGATIKLKISIKSEAVAIKSADGKVGGNVRAKALRRVAWDAQGSGSGKVDSFDLKFERVGDSDGAVPCDADWPFMEAKVEPDTAKIDEDAGKVSGATKFRARLVDAGVYKYSVTATAGDTSYTLDPIIIIEE